MNTEQILVLGKSPEHRLEVIFGAEKARKIAGTTQNVVFEATHRHTLNEILTEIHKKAEQGHMSTSITLYKKNIAQDGFAELPNAQFQTLALLLRCDLEMAKYGVKMWAAPENEGYLGLTISW